MRIQRQHAALVPQQHRRFGGGHPGQGVVLLRACGGIDLGVPGSGGAFDQLKDPPRGGVQVLLVEVARAHGLDQGVVRAGRRHLQVEAGFERGGTVGHRAPVADHQAVETPLAAEYVGQQPAVLAARDAVDTVVRTHDGGRPSRGDDVLERGQVDLAQGPLVHLGTDPKTVRLLAVDREVLERRAHAEGLHTVDPGRADAPCEERILTDVLEVPAAQGRALDVDARPQYDADLMRDRLAGDRPAHPFHQGGIPGRAEAHQRRETCGGHARPDAQGIASLGLFAQAVRAVGEHDRCDSGLRQRLGVPEVAARGQRRFLAQRQVFRSLRVLAVMHGGPFR